MSEWREMALGDVLTLQRGFDLPARERTDGPYPIVSSSGVTGSHNAFKVDPPGVVIGRYGSLGQVHWVEQPFWPLNTSLWVKDFKGNDPRFVSLLLQTLNFDGSTASAVPGVNRNHLHLLPVRRPPVATQRRIAAVVSAFDDIIEINERRIELLEDLARSLYRAWFVQLRFPGHGQREGNALPAGWKVRSVGELTGGNRRGVTSGPFGSKLGRKDYVESGVPVIRGTNLDLGGGFRDSGFVYVSESKAETLGSSIAKPGDIVVTQRGTLGQVGLIPASARHERYVLSQSQMKVTVDEAVGTTEFVYEALRSAETIEWARNTAMTAGVPHINLSMLRELKLLCPPICLQRQFQDAVRPIRRLADALLASTEVLKTTRDLLLPRLIAGQLDISDLNLTDLLSQQVE